ncbi:MAG: Thrombospondin type 3 repeat-containing protein [Candidatus Moranbacteria bacterium GW2011_GWD2_36_12]|nr:MAG: Thrombospondin type 3 repeat-containing protein [Candidatus Moranbacteria bacterium GW2011_GWD2_36_12]KKQ06080.1 MAG: Thrombospondin type 3 repeat-containing protein [Candidatus Moranbacteria bacterium GW2011_GWE2_36_40]
MSEKMKFQLKKIAIICALSVTLFFTSFYLVNFVDIRPAPKKVSEMKVTQNLITGNDEIKKRAASDNISLAAFEDWAKINELSGENVYDLDSDKDGLANYLEYIHGTDPNNADSDGDGFSDSKEISNGYDPDSKGEAMTTVYIKIEKLGVDAPMVWSKTDIEANMLSDLENGLSHYLKTAAPGQNGNMVVSGHSSNYIWAKGNYNHVFKDLNDLQNGDVVTIKTVQKNGRIIEYKYRVNEKFVTTPDDEKIFAENGNATLTLSTCWPLGTNLKRIIVKAELVKA